MELWGPIHALLDEVKMMGGHMGWSVKIHDKCPGCSRAEFSVLHTLHFTLDGWWKSYIPVPSSSRWANSSRRCETIGTHNSGYTVDNHVTRAHGRFLATFLFWVIKRNSPPARETFLEFQRMKRICKYATVRQLRTRKANPKVEITSYQILDDGCVNNIHIMLDISKQICL